jgi:hypothetical protein
VTNLESRFDADDEEEEQSRRRGLRESVASFTPNGYVTFLGEPKR